jgi:hypothetical protein
MLMIVYTICINIFSSILMVLIHTMKRMLIWYNLSFSGNKSKDDTTPET